MLVLRYGDGVAYIPHSVNLGVMVDSIHGSTPIEYGLWVTDLVGQNVTAGQTFCYYPTDHMSSPFASHTDGACHTQHLLFVADWAERHMYAREHEQHQPSWTHDDNQFLCQIDCCCFAKIRLQRLS